MGKLFGHVDDPVGIVKQHVFGMLLRVVFASSSGLKVGNRDAAPLLDGLRPAFGRQIGFDIMWTLCRHRVAIHSPVLIVPPALLVVFPVCVGHKADGGSRIAGDSGGNCVVHLLYRPFGIVKLPPVFVFVVKAGIPETFGREIVVVQADLLGGLQRFGILFQRGKGVCVIKAEIEPLVQHAVRISVYQFTHRVFGKEFQLQIFIAPNHGDKLFKLIICNSPCD